ncbi:phage tail protein [Georgenia sp. 10Sc9-8]|uniref:Phage tail protein n=1 Tax=Georgenia halotolerans TaxID=3028317 RepID=A0ABT5TYA8_9MICO|nr:phage tail protein [Georgenia halotolerans]
MNRPVSRLAEPEQWARCSHHGTALVDGGRGVELAWHLPPVEEGAATAGAGSAVEPAGLAIDRWGRVYRSRPGSGRVVVLPEPPEAARRGALTRPSGLAVDAAQRLYVTEPRRVSVVDLWGQRLLREVPVPGGWAVDVAARGCHAVALLDGPPRLARLDGRRDMVLTARLRAPAPGLAPARVALRPGGEPVVLWTEAARGVVTGDDGVVLVAAEHAGDVEVDDQGRLVLARRPGEAFRVWSLAGGVVELEPRHAEGYDGGALCCDPTGGIAFTTEDGVGRATGSAAVHELSGRMVSYRLDARELRTRWGRVFLDACLPPGTDVRLGFLTSDDEAVPDPLPRSAPRCGEVPVRHPEHTPPLPSVDHLRRTETRWPLHHRATGREQAWAQIADDDAYETYEAPVSAPPGRYLWLVLALTGTGRATPRVREVRVERPGHDLGNDLPRAWTRAPEDADFLQRFLAPAEGMLMDLDARAATRDLLLSPEGAPQETLDWLGSLLGTVLDRRWPVSARRALLREAYDLYRLRGTLAALQRILALYLGRDAAVVESWRLRGLGGAVLGPAGNGPRPPFVAEPGRATEPLGRFAVGGPLPGDDAVLGAEGDVAHRFTVVLPAPLGAEQRGVVETIVETHKPAHTTARICDYTELRIARSRVGISTFVAAETGWAPGVVGQVLLGTDGIVGVPDVAARLGDTTRVGEVRVG